MTAVIPACAPDEVVEVKETTDPVESMITAITELYSTFDVIDDFISSSELVKKKEDLLIPNSVDIIFTDITFLDGDGVAFTLNFGSLGTQAPHGVLCKDEKYRAGVLHVSMSEPYSSSSSEISIYIDSNDAYWSGDGEHMYKITGDMLLKKEDAQTIRVKTEDLDVFVNDEPVRFICDNKVIKTKDAGDGIVNDEISIDGKFKVTFSDQSYYEADIIKSLRKHYELQCIQSIVSGIIRLEGPHSSSQLSADFDPFNDEACDHLVQITINGKSTIYEY